MKSADSTASAVILPFTTYSIGSDVSIGSNDSQCQCTTHENVFVMTEVDEIA